MPKTYNAFVSIDADIMSTYLDHLLTPEAVKEFEDTMWGLGSDPGSGLAELVASQNFGRTWRKPSFGKTGL